MVRFIAVLICALGFQQASAQESGFKSEFLRQFSSDAGKLVELAEAVPADRYDWRPAEGVASIADAHMHIAYYNYYYPETSLGVDTPSDVDLEAFDSIRDKKAVVDHLIRSLEHVRTAVESMTESDMDATTVLYGGEVTRRAVLLQLLTHMNEHLGQQIAYARSNGVVPPWSR